MANIHDADINEDIWDRIRRALGDKNEQASVNSVWLRMGEYAGLWHWSRYRSMTLEEKLSSLSPMIQTALESFLNIAGVILSPGILPVYYPEVQTPCKFPSVDGSIALRCSLPGYCTRESIIIMLSHTSDPRIPKKLPTAYTHRVYSSPSYLSNWSCLSSFTRAPARLLRRQHNA